ncbi:DUF4402 domain-containing protein [Qipengyuania oceanensis]|uniref:DUF4402 domain-containing protein n=1 Tax=Qipengyuania oceanensis TaxID=1463597 RepID=A0A844YJX7_9SPHN|nr:DUF4402 domain-containing protein [Qipengyuania oceanensis]MXO63805.1 DUF4402 domain-containing protein [Qipengyuania oceanensis]
MAARSTLRSDENGGQVEVPNLSFTLFVDNRVMFKAAFLALVAAIALLVTATPAAAQGKCSFCGTNPPPVGEGGGRPGNGGGGGGGGGGGTTGGNGQGQLVLQIESDIDFGRLVLVGSGVGSVLIDLQTGQKVTFGGIDDLGGIAIQGRATITGKPFKAIRVDMPLSVTMSDPGGGRAQLRDFETDLPAFAVLDATGTMTFHFTGRLYTDSAIGLGGVLRGRVPIRVTYD